MLGLGGTPDPRRPPLQGLDETIIEASDDKLTHNTPAMLSANDSSADIRRKRLHRLCRAMDEQLLGRGGVCRCRRSLRRSGAASGAARPLGDARGFAGPATQVIQLGAAHVAAAHHRDLGDQRRIQREHALHALRRS